MKTICTVTMDSRKRELVGLDTDDTFRAYAIYTMSRT